MEGLAAVCTNKIEGGADLSVSVRAPAGTSIRASGRRDFSKAAKFTTTHSNEPGQPVGCDRALRRAGITRSGVAIEVSPRRPSSTIRIFSSAAWCFRVARRMLRTSVSDDVGVGWISVSSSLLEGYRSSSRQFCLTSAEAGHAIGFHRHAGGCYLVAIRRWSAPCKRRHSQCLRDYWSLVARPKRGADDHANTMYFLKN
jgi:hypothetical protein